MNKKVYSAERKMRSQETGVPPAGPTIADVLAAIIALKGDVQSMAATVVSAPPPPPQPAHDDLLLGAERKHEVQLLKTELRGLANSIQQTKSEIAALRPANSDVDRLLVVTNELDAVVSATEGATQTILDSVEQVDTAATAIHSHNPEPAVARLADEIKENVIAIFEACNFQDITGQRITKVVNTLKFIEERVEAMIEIWGRESFEDLPSPPEVEHEDKDAKLLNGPQLAAISQDDIDKLFG